MQNQPSLAAMLRVNHAGEYGAVQIYKGQLRGLRRSDENQRPVIEHMLEQEQQHKKAFEDELIRRRVRPSLLMPLWHAGGYALGAVTAAMGSKSAMACTMAVEEVIDEHYASQIASLKGREPELAAQLERFRQEEVEHGHTATTHGAEQAPGFSLLRRVVRAGSKLSIRLAQRL